VEAPGSIKLIAKIARIARIENYGAQSQRFH
jgi:hypothetical protein